MPPMGSVEAPVGSLSPRCVHRTPAPFAFGTWILALHFQPGSIKVGQMMQPLALLLYERLLPGSQLVNRLQDHGYRVSTVPGAGALVETCRREKPIVLLVDVSERADATCAALTLLRDDPETGHIPVIAIIPSQAPSMEEAARRAGAKLVVQDVVILPHLEQFLEQALHLD